MDLEEGKVIQYRIAICDDDIFFCTFLEKSVEKYFMATKEKVEIDIYYSGEKLYESLKAGLVYDLIFLDIELKLTSGVEVGKKIREEIGNELVQIVYISGKSEYAMELFKIRPQDFLLKPVEEKQITEVLVKTKKLLKTEKDYFEFCIGTNIYRVRIKDILYFNSNVRKINLVTNEDVKVFYGKLTNIEKKLESSQFLAIHKSYLVHMDCIAEYQYESVKMINGDTLPISQSYRKKVKKVLLEMRKDNFDDF